MAKSAAWHQGVSNGHLLSKPFCPYPPGQYADDWEAGFLVGREEMREEFRKWQAEQVSNKPLEGK